MSGVIHKNIQPKGGNLNGIKETRRCNKKINSKIKKCPNVGAPIKKPISTGSKYLIATLLTLLIGGIFSSFDTPSSTSSRKWFQGGNLHNATLAQWKSATYQNRLATAADWLAVTRWKGHLNSPSDFDKLKTKAQILVRAVGRVVAGREMDQLGFMRITEIAAALITMSNDLGP